MLQVASIAHVVWNWSETQAEKQMQKRFKMKQFNWLYRPSAQQWRLSIV